MKCKRCGALMIPVLTDKKVQCTEFRCSDDGCYWASVEPCVLCGKPSGYLKGDNVEGRANYTAAGQLCPTCAQTLQ